MNKKEKLTKKLEILSQMSNNSNKEKKLNCLRDLQKDIEIVNKKLRK